MCTTSEHAVVGFGGTVLVVVVDVVLVDDDDVVLEVDVDVLDVEVVGDDVDDGVMTMSVVDDDVEPATVVVAPGSADRICSLHAASNTKPASPANARAGARRTSITARSPPIPRPSAASSRRDRAPNIRRCGRSPGPSPA